MGSLNLHTLHHLPEHPAASICPVIIVEGGDEISSLLLWAALNDPGGLEFWRPGRWGVQDLPIHSQKCNSLPLSKIACVRARLDMNICDALLYQNIC